MGRPWPQGATTKRSGCGRHPAANRFARSKPSEYCEQRRLEPGWEDPCLREQRQNDPAVEGVQRSTDSHARRPSRSGREHCLEPGWEDLASAGGDDTIRLWEASSGQPLRTLLGHESFVSSVAWSPDGKILASGSDDRTIRLWPGSVDALLDQVRDRIRLFRFDGRFQRYFGLESCPAVR